MPDVMTVSQVAEQLGCRTEDEVMRLISRGALKATQLPDGYRVVEDVLAAYVQAGAPDFVAPPDEPLLAYVQGFEQAIFKAAFPQFWSDATAKAKAGNAPAGSLFDQPLTLSPAIKAVVDGPVGKLISEIPGNTIRDRYKSWGALWLTAMLRRSVKRATQEAKLKWGAGLFTGRADYEAILTGCWKIVALQTLTQEVRTQFNPPAGPTYTIRYNLPVSTFADTARLNAATALAF